MNFPYVRRIKEIRRSRWILEDGFRLWPTLPTEVNAVRLMRHLADIQKADRRTPSGKRFALRLRRLRRAKG